MRFICFLLFATVQTLVITDPIWAYPTKNACIAEQNVESRMRAYFQKLEARKEKMGSDSIARIAGIEFVDESPTLLWAFRELVAAKEIPNLQNKRKVNPSCKKVLCAADKIFGSGVGKRMIYLQARFDLNSSSLVFEDVSTFRVFELDSIINAAHLYPEHLLPIERSQQLVKFKRGYVHMMDDPSNPSILANATMSFFDIWSEASPDERIYTVVHEIAHNMSYRRFPDKLSYSVPSTTYQRLDDSEDWFKLSGWKDQFSSARTLKSAKFVSQYAQSNAGEDFAESVTYYLLSPSTLKSRHPEKYDFIKLYVFGGQEFYSHECEKTTIVDEIRNKYSATLELQTETEIQQFANACIPSKHFTYVAQNSFNCMARILINQILEDDYGIKTGLIPIELANTMTGGFSVHFPKVYSQVIDYAKKNEAFSLHNNLSH